MKKKSQNETQAILAESLDVIRDLLKYGEHNEPCTNEPDRKEPCWRHESALAKRRDRANEFLARASGIAVSGK